MIYSTRVIQQRLADLGYDPGPIDGIRGRRTVSAIKAFQKDNELLVDGIVGTVTRSKLFANLGGFPTVQDPDRPWYEEAKRLLGTKEKPGPISNPIILDWAEDLEVAYSGDDVPWCGLFTAHCIGATLPDEELPSNFLSARSWLRFGKSVPPSKGAILVFWRGSRNGWQGHVGFYAGEDATSYYVLGGNQSDSVSIARLGRSRLLDSRWPDSVAFGETIKVALNPDGSPFSIDEA